MPSRILESIPAAGDTPPQSLVALPAPPQQLQQQQQQSHQQAMVPAASPPAALKLSFGGVDFCLLPRTGRDGSVSFEAAMGATEAVLSLKNFTGTLRVTSCLAHNDFFPTANNHFVEDSASPSPEKPMHLPSPKQQQILPWAQQGLRQNHPSPIAAAAGAAARNMTVEKSTYSQAPTPTTNNVTGTGARLSNNKRNNFEVEQVVAANRSSPLPYHSPVKRSRQSQTTTNTKTSDKNSSNNNKKTKKKAKPLSEHLPTSPIALGQKSKTLSIPDYSQTMPSESSTGGEEEAEEIVTATSSQPQLQNEKDGDEGVDKAQKENVGDKADAKDDEDGSVATRLAEDDDDIEMDDDDDEDEEENKQKVPKNAVIASTPSQQTSAEDDATASPILECVSAVVPSPRWGHTMTMVDHGRMLLYGGQSFLPNEEKGGDVVPTTMSDVHIFDVDKQKWFQPISCDDKTRQWPRQWHSATFLPQRQLLICFGGEFMHPKTGRVTTSDKNNLMVLDTEILLWYPPSVSGDLPSGRSGHSATLLPSSSNNELVIFGGVKGGKHLNSVSVLDTTRWIWSTPKIQGVAPKARSYHSATAIQATHCGSNPDGIGGHHSDHISNSKNATINICQRIVIFGGNDHTKSFNTVHVLEKIEGATTSWRWFHPQVSGQPPQARTGHSATLLADQKTICFFGGWDPCADEDNSENKDPKQADEEVIFQDSYLLDTDKWEWKKGSTPVFAGLSMDSSQGTDGGARRTGHSAVLNTNNKEANEIVIFGGRVPGDDFAGDFQTLTIS